METRLWIATAFVFSCTLLGEPYYFNNPNQARTICGQNDMLNMVDQNGDLKAMGLPIGIYRAGNMSCTGTLISSDLFLTARHCYASCANVKVTFGYLGNGSGESYAYQEIIEKGGSSSNQDYMVLRLSGAPGNKWGWYPPSSRELTAENSLLMVHHPGGSPMKVSIEGCVLKTESSGMLRHRCDSNPGSSGSGILVPDYDEPEKTVIVGVHTMGGCDSGLTTTNSGPSMRYLLGVSPILTSLAVP